MSNNKYRLRFLTRPQREVHCIINADRHGRRRGGAAAFLNWTNLALPSNTSSLALFGFDSDFDYYYYQLLLLVSLAYLFGQWDYILKNPATKAIS
jgi:hypothetical protein